MLTIYTLGLAALMAAPGGQVANVSLYGGRPIDGQGIRLLPWGSGSIKDSTDISIAGEHSLRISTASYFQGGVIQWDKPIPVAELAKNKQNLLQVSVYVLETKAASGRTSGDPTRGGGEMGSGGMMAGGGRTGGTQATGTAVKQMENLRLVIRTSDDKLSEVVIPLATATGATGKWRRLGIPLTAIPGLAKTNQEIVSISLAGDAPATFYLGEIRVVTDQTPIQGYLPHREMNLARGDEVVLWATAEAGYSVLVYEWDFDASDGIQVEATGPVLYHRFRIPSYNPDPNVAEPAKPFIVTLTIRDVHGLKKPWQGTIQVTVNP
ncbi:MAG: hypothetical protein IH851_10115 [Armatimonadetes bacterium]|nr:hypothetical protein [Armatimonadota bacterium]